MDRIARNVPPTITTTAQLPVKSIKTLAIDEASDHLGTKGAMANTGTIAASINFA